ncbi:EAL domain-containing protein [Persephonella sp.]
MNFEIIEPYIEEIFQKFYREILSDQFLKTFFSSEDQIKNLVKKQIKNFKETLKEDEKQLEARYYNLGNLHYDLKIPFVNLMSGIDFIKNEIYRYLADKKLLDEYFFSISLLFDRVKNSLAKAYLDRSLDEMTGGYKPEYKDYKFFKYHLQWLEKLNEVAKSFDKNRVPELDSRYCKLGKWIRSREFHLICGDNKKCFVIHELHDLIHNTGKSLVYYIFHKKFVEAYLLFKTLNSLSLKMMNELYEVYFHYMNNREEKFLYFLSKEIENIKSGYLTVVNIRKLKAINEIYGKKTGDYILDTVERLIREKFIKKDEILIKGISGEFFIFSEDKGDSLKERFTKLKKNLESNKNFPVGVKIIIGTVQLPEDITLSPEDIRKIVGIAREKAKSETGFYFADASEVEEKIIPKINIQLKDSAFITQTIAEEKIDLFFQPVVNLKLGDTYGFEVLVRIKKDEGYINAGTFIDLLHRLGIIVDLDRLVIKKVIQNADKISKITNTIFVNISPESLKSEDFISLLTDGIKILKRKNIKLIVELTEQSFLENIEIIKFLHEEFGISFAVDDFGTGYSSLKTVIDLTETGLIEILKIDGSLVRDLKYSARNQKIVRLISSMSKNLKIKTVAEFIENRELIKTVRDMGIQLGQGYALGRPKPIDEFISG